MKFEISLEFKLLALLGVEGLRETNLKSADNDRRYIVIWAHLEEKLLQNLLVMVVMATVSPAKLFET